MSNTQGQENQVSGNLGKLVEAEKIAKANAAEAADAVAAKSSSTLEAIEAQIQQSGERIRHAARSILEGAGKRVGDHPTATVGLAFIAGIVAAHWLRRASS